MPRPIVRSATRLEIDRARDAPSLQIQVYQELRKLIAEGWVEKDARLPSTRQLANEMGIYRGVVLAALEDMLSDGW